MRKRGGLILSLMLVFLMTACQNTDSTDKETGLKESEVTEQVDDIKVSETNTEESDKTLTPEEEETVDMGGAPQEPVKDEKIPSYEFVLLDGDTVQLDQYEGQVVLVTFFTTWCTYCEKEIPALQKFSEDIEDLTVIGINVKESKETLEPYLEEKGVTFPIVMDESGEWASTFFVSGFPTTVFISPEGTLLGSVPGYVPEDNLLELIDVARTYDLKKE